MSLRAAPACLIITVCLGVAGCGSDDDSSQAGSGEKAAVAAAARGYFTAIGNLDAAGVCRSLTTDAQRQVVTQSGTSEKTCERVLGLGFQQLSQQQRQALAAQRTLQPSQIEVKGNTATGLVQFQGQTTRVDAAKVDGQWKLSNAGDQQIVAK